MDYQDIKKEIEGGNPAPVYFFFGEEAYWIDVLTHLAAKHVVNSAAKDFNFDILLGEESDGNGVVDLASSYPMMSDRRLVILKNVQKLSSSDKNRIQTYVEAPLESTTLVMTAGKIDRRQRFYAALVKHSRWVESKPLYENQAQEWVQRSVRERGVTITSGAAAFLVSQVGTSLWALHNEIDKVLTFSWGKKNIGEEDVASIAGFSRKYNSWEMTDAVGSKNLKEALSILEHLLEKGQSPVGLIMELSRRVFLLMRLRSMIERRVSPDDIQKALRLRPYFFRLYKEQARRYSMQDLRQAAELLMKTDVSIKTGYMPDELDMTLAVYGIIHGTT